VGKPADRIALDSDALVVTAKRVGSHADDIRANHMATQASLNDALYGCVGSSGEELGRLSQRWAAVGTRHGERLDALSRHVGQAGVRLTDTDDANAAKLARLGNQMR
jgi:uncharacterized protein YukE